jgi:hypothetical protein
VSFLDKLRAKLKPETQNPDDAVRAVLLSHGDDGTKSRLVDHLANFETQHEAAAYMTFVQGLGFTLDQANEEFSVAFTKESSVVGQEFDDELAKLYAKAEELNGHYDGWGCSVAQ